MSTATHPASTAPVATDASAAAAPLPVTTTGGASAYPVTPADVHFMSGMIIHHAQAIVMSRMAPTHGASPTVRTLAARIINSQADEIASMKQWLREKGQAVATDSTETGAMAMPGMDHDMLMPGMLTAAQLKQLDDARGPAFDRLFLELMIQHHRGAITMVDTLFSTQGAAQDEAIFKFASDASVDQSTEINRMERLLASLQTTPPSH